MSGWLYTSRSGLSSTVPIGPAPLPRSSVSHSSARPCARVGSADRHRGGGRGRRGADRLLSAKPCRLSRGSGVMGRGLRVRRRTVAQLRVLRGSTGWHHSCHHCPGPPRCDRRAERPGLYVRGDPRHRDRHWDRLRRDCAVWHRSWRRPASTGCAVCWRSPCEIFGASRRARFFGRRTTGRLIYTAASSFCPIRPSRCNARNLSRLFRRAMKYSAARYTRQLDLGSDDAMRLRSDIWRKSPRPI